MKRALPSSSRPGSAFRSTASISSPTIPTGCRWAAGRIRAARCASPTSSSATPPTRSSKRESGSAGVLFETDPLDIEFRGGWFGSRARMAVSGSSRWRARRRREAIFPRRCAASSTPSRPDRRGRRLSLRHAHLRGRDRPRYRRGGNREMERGRRCRARGRSAHSPWADPWRGCAGDRAGPARDLPLSPRRCAIALGLLHGLRGAARVLSSILRLRPDRNARREPSLRHPPGQDQKAWHERRRSAR